MPTVDQIRREKLLDADNERFSILINEKRILPPESFTFNEYFDACSNSFEVENYPNEPNNTDLSLTPGGLEPVSINILGDAVLIGNVEIPSYIITPESSSISFSGRNATRLLEKSALPENVQREFKNMSLKNIAIIVCNAFNLDVEIGSGVDVSRVFKRATYKDSQTAYAFLSRLCKEVGAVLSNTGVGRPIIRKSSIGNPVAKFDIDAQFISFLGIEGIVINYDTTKIYGKYIGKTQTPKKTLHKSTKTSTIIEENSVKYLTFDDSTGGTLKKMVETAEKKGIREFYTNSIPYPSWINPQNGKRWKAGDTIVVGAIEAHIDNKEVLINRVEFKSNPGSEVALLYFIPVETYE